MAKISALAAREILDSRGFPTIEAEVRLESGVIGRAAVPSGASTGEHEAVELRDGDKSRYGGKGVLKAAGHVSGELAKALAGKDPRNQQALDDLLIQLDGTPNKSKFGANAILAASLAVSRAAAASENLPLYRYLRQAYAIKDEEWLLPTPMFNVINGGKHADSGLDVQEFMLVPVGLESFAQSLRAGSEIYQALKKMLAAKKMTVAVGDEGGFAPKLENHQAALDILAEAVRSAGYQGRVRLALDAAASEFFSAGKYLFEKKSRSAADMVEIYGHWINRYSLISLEDALDQDDWSGWKEMTKRLGTTVTLVGDDIFVTNPTRLARGIEEGCGNSILIKLNQIGTLSETVATVRKAQKAGFSCVISHRSGETEDPYIADLAVALNAGAIKTGAPCRSERLAKYNQLLRIEMELGPKARYAGSRCFASALSAGA